MARDPIAYTFTGPTNPDGTAAEFIPGLPCRTIHKSEFDGMTDEEKAALYASPLHRAYGHADEEAAEAAKRVEMTPDAPEPAKAAEEPADKPSKAEAKK